MLTIQRNCMALAVGLFFAGLSLATAYADAPCGDVYGGTWQNPPFGYNIYRNGQQIQFTPGVFDAPDGTPLALDAAGNIFHAQTIDSQGTVRVYRNNVSATTFGPRGGPSWVYSGLGLAIQTGGTWYVGFYTSNTTVTVYRNGANSYRTYTAYDFSYSPVQLAWDDTSGQLYASIRTGVNETTVYAEATPVAVYSGTRGCGVAARGGHWYTAVPTGSAQITVYRDGAVYRTINGSFTASFHVNLALDGRLDPFILVPSSGQFGIFDYHGTRIFDLPNTAGGGGTGLWIQPGTGCVVRGDLNCDGAINFDDIDPFVQILSDLAGWQAAHPGCPWQNGDCNADGALNFDDIDPFVAILSG